MRVDTLTSIRVFRQVVESGSFVAAAERMDLSTAMVSKHVAYVEKRLGVRLLNRNSRTLSLTEPGSVYFERCKTILDDLEATELELGSLGTVPRGTVPSDPSSSSVASRSSSMVLQRSKYTLPGSVRLSVRLFRFNSRTPSRFSTYATCLLTIAVERSMRSAAATKLPASTTCLNTLMLVSVSTRIVYVRGWLVASGLTLRGPASRCAQLLRPVRG